MRELPLAIDDPERNILIRRPSSKVQQHRLVVPRLLDDLVRRRFGLVDEVRVEDVELVALYDFRRGVVRAKSPPQQYTQNEKEPSASPSGGERKNGYALVMRLVVLVPLVACVHPVKVPRLPRTPFVFPVVAGRVLDVFLDVEQFFFLVEVLLCLCAEERFGGNVSVAGRRLWCAGLLLHRLSCTGYEAGSGHLTALGDLCPGFRKMTNGQDI